MSDRTTSPPTQKSPSSFCSVSHRRGVLDAARVVPLVGVLSKGCSMAAAMAAARSVGTGISDAEGEEDGNDGEAPTTAVAAIAPVS